MSEETPQFTPLSRPGGDGPGFIFMLILAALFGGAILWIMDRINN